MTEEKIYTQSQMRDQIEITDSHRREIKECEQKKRDLEISFEEMLKQKVGYARGEVSEICQIAKGLIGKIEIICSQERAYFPNELKNAQMELVSLLEKYQIDSSVLLDTRLKEIKKGHY